MTDRPWRKKYAMKNCLLTISPPVTSVCMQGYQDMVAFTNKRRKLKLEGVLLHSTILPGQLINFKIQLYNPEETKIKKIEALFIQHRKTSINHYKQVISSLKLPNLTEFNGLHFTGDFDLPVPSFYLTPTHKFSISDQEHSHGISVDYELVLKVKPHGILETLKFEYQ